jgi:hypothetical protein
MSVELWGWLYHIVKVWNIPERSGGMWLEGWMACEAGDSVRRV